MKNLKLIKLYGLSALVLTSVLLAYPPKSGKGQTESLVVAYDSNRSKASKSDQTDYSRTTAELNYDIEHLIKKEARIIEEKLNKPPKVVVKTKTVQPKSIRIYYRVNGEVVSENVLTKEGDFFILDIDSVLPEVIPEPDPIKESVQDLKLDTIEKRKWWQFKRRLYER